MKNISQQQNVTFLHGHGLLAIFFLLKFTVGKSCNY
jgi:hypothetical protein